MLNLEEFHDDNMILRANNDIWNFPGTQPFEMFHRRLSIF